MQLTVVKRSGATEAFSRDKAIAGVRKACKGRPLTEDDLARLGQVVEDALRGSGHAEFASHEIGMAILEPLRELDEVAYLRFAAVYKQFETAEDFEIEIAALRASRAEQLAEMVGEMPEADTQPQHRLTTDRPVRRGEAAYRAHQSVTRLSLRCRCHQQH